VGGVGEGEQLRIARGREDRADRVGGIVGGRRRGGQSWTWAIIHGGIGAGDEAAAGADHLRGVGGGRDHRGLLDAMGTR
jgi:hypothetical protein